MAKQETVERWAREAGVELERVKFDGSNPVVWHSCGRCGGKGFIYGFGHVEGGRCFACYGAKGSFVGLQGLASRARKRDRKPAEEARKRRAVVAQAREFLAATPGLAEALRADRKFDLLRSFASQLARKGQLSDRQVEVAMNAKARAEAPKDPVEQELDVPEGRQAITGTVVSVKEQQSQFGWQQKMLVKVTTEAGTFKVWGTVPRAIDYVAKGCQVTFTATLKSKEKGFGFFSRPTGATCLDEA